MGVSLHHIVIDAHDLPMLARFWAQVLGWRILSERERAIKNRLHLDLDPGTDDRQAEIERLLALGAREVDIGQTGDESWTVLADPEGNEFCVLRPKTTLVS